MKIYDRIKLLASLKGQTLATVCNEFNYNGDKYTQLAKGTQKQKGIIGDFIEEIITGQVKDNICEADCSLGDIKTVNVNAQGMPRENLRITAVNYNTIQTTDYTDSGLFCKAKMIVVKYILNKDKVTDSVIYSVGFVDLTDNQQVKNDYNNIRNIISIGQAHLLTSRKNQPYSTIIKTYSHGSGHNNKKYTVGNNTYEAKGKAFYLFKQELQQVFEEI